MSSTPTTTDPASVTRYPPLEQFFGPSAALGADARGQRLTPARLAARLVHDTVLRVAIWIAVAVLLLENVMIEQSRPIAVAVPVAFVALQIAFAAFSRAPRWWTLFRLGFSLLFVLACDLFIDPSGMWPLNALVVPIVALAASMGGRPAVALAGLGIVTALLPVVSASVPVEVDRDAVAIAMAAFVMAIGSRRTVRTLERSATRLRRANTRDRRRARQFAALETVGRLLARQGTSSDALDQVMGLLEETFGYKYPSVYLLDGAVLRLGAQRNYRFPIETIPLDQGVIGRVVRTREPILLRDARNDPDFQSGDPAVIDEIAVPLMGDEELFGILNVETDARHRLDDDDFATMLIVGDRIAAAIALGRERQKLTERTQLLDRLTLFEATLNASLDPQTVHQFVVTGAAKVIPSEMVILVLHQAETDEFRTIAIDGGDERIVGVRIEPGEGITGRAISNGALVVDDHLARANWPRSASKARLADVLTAMSVPLVHDDAVVGAMSWFREDTIQIFTTQEQEIATLIANRVALALVNATLHHEAQEAAITDPLTALHNRRHFDASVAHDDALRSRLGVGDRRERSAILFDLDHFGAINKRHGHRVGDEILRTFADVLRSRVRASDLVARYGGEEFVVILDGASRDEAVRLADEIRVAFRQVGIDAADSGLPITTVSAGCASLDRIETSGSVLIERADVGLAMAKAGGRDQVVAA